MLCTLLDIRYRYITLHMVLYISTGIYAWFSVVPINACTCTYNSIVLLILHTLRCNYVILKNVKVHLIYTAYTI